MRSKEAEAYEKTMCDKAGQVRKILRSVPSLKFTAGELDVAVSAFMRQQYACSVAYTMKNRLLGHKVTGPNTHIPPPSLSSLIFRVVFHF